MSTARRQSESRSLYCYNLFRRKREQELYCAVPEDRAVPGFLNAESWEFGGKVNETEPLPGFNRNAARTGVRFNGFYLFQACRGAWRPHSRQAQGL